MCWLQNVPLRRTDTAVCSASQYCLLPWFTAVRRRALDRQCKTFKPPRVSEEQEEDAKPKQLNQVRGLVNFPGVVRCITCWRSFSLDGVRSIALTDGCIFHVSCSPLFQTVTLVLRVPSLEHCLLNGSLVLSRNCTGCFHAVSIATRRRAFPFVVTCRSRCSRGSRRKRLDATRRPHRRRLMTTNE